MCAVIAESKIMKSKVVTELGVFTTKIGMRVTLISLPTIHVLVKYILMGHPRVLEERSSLHWVQHRKWFNNF
jgi:hypothetical protein